MSDFDIASTAEGEVLVLSFTGRATSDNARAITKRYFEILLASGFKKVLADVRRLQGRLSAGETYFLMRDLPPRPVPGRIRTAIVESESNRAYAEYLETTAANAGVRFKCFVDCGEAASWLAAPCRTG